MNRIFLVALLLMAAFLTSCAKTYQKDNFQLQENWIDDSDLQYALAHPNLKEWFPRMGNPVLTEYQNDTILFIYNYHPALFRTVKNGVEYKPTNEDRMANAWGKRTEFVGLQIKDNKLIGIETIGEMDRAKYSKVRDQKQAEVVTEQKNNNWLVYAVIGIATAVFVIYMATN